MVVERTTEAHIRWKGGTHILGDGEDLGFVEEIHAHSLPNALMIGV